MNSLIEFTQINNSTIKTKTGKCIDCPSGTNEKPLISKRCQLHYKVFRAESNAKKNPKTEWKSEKRKEMNIFLNKKPQNHIPRRSKKRIVQELQYNADVKVYLVKAENRICPVTGKQTNQVHHKKGRIGDLLLDQRYWLSVSSEGHDKIEMNPIWAKEMGYSLNRL